MPKKPTRTPQKSQQKKVPYLVMTSVSFHLFGVVLLSVHLQSTLYTDVQKETYKKKIFMLFRGTCMNGVKKL